MSVKNLYRGGGGINDFCTNRVNKMKIQIKVTFSGLYKGDPQMKLGNDEECFHGRTNIIYKLYIVETT